MLVAKFIGRIPVMIGAVLFAIAGVVLIVMGATATPTDSGTIVIGAVFVAGAVLLFVDAATDPRGHRASGT
jgi:membrane protein CcdC involved in cytochrome C biogenesis